MYFVDREKILTVLASMDHHMAQMDRLFAQDGYAAKLAQERFTDVMISSILEVGHLLIDGFLMRDAGSYEDIICILADEKVLPSVEKEMLIKLIALRPDLHRAYLDLDQKAMVQTVQAAQQVLRYFPQHVHNYLEKEADVAHAFGKRD